MAKGVYGATAAAMDDGDHAAMDDDDREATRKTDVGGEVATEYDGGDAAAMEIASETANAASFLARMMIG